MPAILKGTLESALLRSGLASFVRRSVRGRALVLAYHNVLPDGAPLVGERALHISRHSFTEQLDHIVQVANVVPLGDLFTPSGLDQRPRVVITFDDAYVGAVTVGVTELRQRGLPATIFVAPGLLGGRPFWWDDAVRLGVGSVPRRLREALIEQCAGRDEEVRDRQALSAGASRMPPWARSATIVELAEAVQGGAISLGAHSWGHPNLTAVGASELDAELERPLAWLREMFPDHAVPWVSYPYGRHSDSVHRAAELAGCVGAFRIEGGWLPVDARPGFALPRLNVPAGLSPDGFALRLAGLLCR